MKYPYGTIPYGLGSYGGFSDVTTENFIPSLNNNVIIDNTIVRYFQDLLVGSWEIQLVDFSPEVPDLAKCFLGRSIEYPSHVITDFSVHEQSVQSNIPFTLGKQIKPRFNLVKSVTSDFLDINKELREVVEEGFLEYNNTSISMLDLTNTGYPLKYMFGGLESTSVVSNNNSSNNYIITIKEEI